MSLFEIIAIIVLIIAVCAIVIFDRNSRRKKKQAAEQQQRIREKINCAILPPNKGKSINIVRVNISSAGLSTELHLPSER